MNRQQFKGIAPMTMLVITGITLARIAALFISPLELSGDEAQYWAWAQHLDFGYFSKPPLIAWGIRLFTSLFGDSEAVIRLASPLLHALSAGFLFLAGKTFIDGDKGVKVGALAALVYITAPGIWFSSGIITTDAFLLAAYAGALAALALYIKYPTWRNAALLGLGLGVGIMAKYAMLYFLPGLVLAAALDRDVRKILFRRQNLLAIGIMLGVIAPNIYWNATHQFSTLGHTAANANWHPGPLHPGHIIRFIGDQAAIFGPLTLFALFAALAKARAAPRDRVSLLLASLTLIPLLVVLVQAVINRANANWAVSAYVPGALLLAVWSQTARWHRVAVYSAIGLNVIFGLIIALIALSPRRADDWGFANAFKHVHGWHQSAQSLDTLAHAGWRGKPFGAVLSDNRMAHYALGFYGQKMDLPPLYIWPRTAGPHSQAELMTPLKTGDTRPILVISLRRDFAARMAADFDTFIPLGTRTIAVGRGKVRRFAFFAAQGYRPLARDEAWEKRWPTAKAKW